MNLLLSILLYLSIAVNGIDESSRPENGVYQYQYSFSGPFGGSHIPFWETGGSAVVMDNYVRLTPNQQSQKGWIWTSRPLRTREWEIQLHFAVGSDNRQGADGMALWYTKERAQSGPIMGNIDRWTGLGVILDTFDNDGQRDNPSIYAVYNDHSFSLSPSADGKQNTLGICSANIRQQTSNPEKRFIKVAVRLKDKTLQVFYDNSNLVGSESVWTECFTAPIPIDDQLSGYYIGVTAETGGLSDFHYLKGVATWSIRSPPPKKELTVDPREAKIMEEAKIQTRRKVDEDPFLEIMNRLIELEKRDETFSTVLDTKYVEMEQKLELTQAEQMQILQKIQYNIDHIHEVIEVSRIEELKKDIKSAISVLNTVQQLISTVELELAGATQQAQQLHNIHNTLSDNLADQVERSTNRGFWIYFIIFQLLFWGLLFWWRKNREEKTEEKKFL